MRINLFLVLCLLWDRFFSWHAWMLECFIMQRANDLSLPGAQLLSGSHSIFSILLAVFMPLYSFCSCSLALCDIQLKLM
jgi:hypothetical protein